ncbi:myoneurin isoform X23 [Manduca sexta]|uniref:myoneurin isoform X23 n=1 Tax=Manduca sexta TaxID=7130 RepID=UPI00188FCF51|nr:myoneurin isoform X23 [Manduca sexta]
MDGKTSDWRPGPSVCRCCLAEGCYKDISTEYFWMGKREVYADMLSDTFSVSIAYSSAGGPNSHSRLICEPCISRLRDAADFKRQVQECERTFMQHLDPGSTSAANDIDIEAQPAGKEVKLEQVKLEKRFSDDDFDTADFGDEDDDDMDDQPLTKFATKVPKKEAVDFLDLIDNSQITVKRMSMSKSKAPPAKKVKVTKKEPAKPTASKAPIKVVKEKKKKDVIQRDPVRRNAELVVKYTTAYPFRVNAKSVLCVYCGDLYDNPNDFRQHMESEHKTFRLNMVFLKLNKTDYVKVDITNLACRLCSQKYDDLNQIVHHLKEHHKKAISLESKLGVMPYILEKNRWNCAVCGKILPSLLHLNKHTITHYMSYVCDICGKGYVASTGLLQHMHTKHQNHYKAHCRRCAKAFPSMEAKAQHQKTERKCMPHCCADCTERFPNWEIKQRHMVNVHGMVKKVYDCSICDVTSSDRRAFYEHFKMYHSQDCLVCPHCRLKFASSSRLNRHMSKHVL